MSTKWPPPSGKLSTPTLPASETTFTIIGTTTIQAPASKVFAVTRDISKYGEWNSFCPTVTIQSQPEDAGNPAILHVGTFFTFGAVMDSSKPNKVNDTALQVSDISTPDHPSSYIPSATLEQDETYTSDLSKIYRIAWKSAPGLITLGVRTERFHEIIVLGENECEVRTWENMAGPLAYVVKWMYQKTLDAKFQDWCDDLKKYCEKGLQQNT